MASTTLSNAPVRELPGEPVPYHLADGDGRAHLLLGQVGRTLAGAEESSGLMSVMTAVGPAGGPIPLHYHDAEHDIFFCVRGTIQVWADGVSRILHPGDFASVPSGVVHAYQFHGHHSQFMGPIAPAGWDRFFDFTGSPYAGAAYPQVDPSPPPFEKFGAAEGKFAMKYVRDQPYTEATDGPDDSLPGAHTAYFLRAGEGPRHELGGEITFQLLTGSESAGKLGMTVTEGPRGTGAPAHSHASTYEGIYCLEGRLRVRAGGEEQTLGRGEFMSIPAGVQHALVNEGHLTRYVTMYGPAGPERIAELAGQVSEHRIFPEAAAPVDLERVREALSGIDVELAG